MRRISIVLGALIAALAFLPGTAAHADPYGPGTLPTSCTVETPGAVDGKRVVVEVTVTANAVDQPQGTVDVSISRRGAAARGRAVQAAPVWTKKVTYDGIPVRITGPELDPGQYVVNMRFRPSSNAYSGCRNALVFGVGGEVDAESAGPGGLPNTGGPHLAFLLLGVGLVVGGGTVASRSRRSRTS